MKSEKETTRVCPNCGNEDLLEFRTLNLKTCTDCDTDINWYLDKDQKPLI